MSELLDLVIVSGASKGIGNNIVFDLAPVSKNIIGMGSSETIYELYDDQFIKNHNCNIRPLRVDLKRYKYMINLLQTDMENLSSIKNIGIVLCGAMLGKVGNIFDNNLYDWEQLYKCNVLGNLAIIKSVEKYLKEGAKCNIVFFSGGGANSPFEFGGYALSKAAIVRAVENLAVEFEKKGYDASIIALAPGFIPTDMGKQVIASGSVPKTQTDISEPTNFVRKFLTGEFGEDKIKQMNGRFIHCRDNIAEIDFSKKDILKLRRIE